MTLSSQIVGVILAGGRSRRFGGGDKGLAELHGETILARVAQRLQPQVSKLILNANGGAERFGALALDVVPDEAFAGLGPLSGMLAALRWSCRNMPGATALATVTADAPFIPNDLVVRLDAMRAGGAAIAVSGEHRHPTIGLWPMACEDAMAQALESGSLSVNSFAGKVGAVEVGFAIGNSGGRPFDPFFNINTPDDLAAARAVLAGQQ